MRMLFASMMICCCAVAGYSQDQTEVCDASETEKTVEITVEKEGDENGSETASVGTDSFSGCGCDKKPKI